MEELTSDVDIYNLKPFYSENAGSAWKRFSKWKWGRVSSLLA